MRVSDVLIKPQITEKAMDRVSRNIYSFQVNTAANKHQIKAAVASLFKVEVGPVRVIVRKGKIRRVGKRRMIKKLPDKKIAHITVTKGTIDLFPKT